MKMNKFIKEIHRLETMLDKIKNEPGKEKERRVLFAGLKEASKAYKK